MTGKKTTQFNRTPLSGAGCRGIGVANDPDADGVCRDPVGDQGTGKVLIGIQGDNPPWGFRRCFRQAGWLRCGYLRALRQGTRRSRRIHPAGGGQSHPGTDIGPCRYSVRDHGDAAGAGEGRAVQQALWRQHHHRHCAQGRGNQIAGRHGKVCHRRCARQRPGHARDQGRAGRHHHPALRWRRADDAGAAVRSGSGHRRQHLLRPRLDESKPGTYENKLEFTKLYNGACTRLGEQEINAFANDFIDKIRSNGELAKIYPK